MILSLNQLTIKKLVHKDIYENYSCETSNTYIHLSTHIVPTTARQTSIEIIIIIIKIKTTTIITTTYRLIT